MPNTPSSTSSRARRKDPIQRRTPEGREIGQRIRAWRYDRGWTQPELAERSGLNKENISRIECGAMPNPYSLLRLSRALNVPLDDLLNSPFARQRVPLAPAPGSPEVRQLAARHIRKETCQRGHAFTPENTYTSPKGLRSCRACAVLRQQPDWKRASRRTAGMGAKTECIRGHSLTDPDNVFVTKRGYRICRACTRLRQHPDYRRTRTHPNPRPLKTECIRGHDMTNPDNVYTYKRGAVNQRICRTCARLRRFGALDDASAPAPAASTPTPPNGAGGGYEFIP